MLRLACQVTLCNTTAVVSGGSNRLALQNTSFVYNNPGGTMCPTPMMHMLTPGLS